MKGDDIAERLLDFACGSLEVVENLPRTRVGRHISDQLMGSGTSGGANYEEARGAESPADFAHKAGVAAKEVRESVYWLRIVERRKMTNRGGPMLIQEGRELASILMASARTARRQCG
jgi:four helix bundle protein